MDHWERDLINQEEREICVQKMLTMIEQTISNTDEWNKLHLAIEEEIKNHNCDFIPNLNDLNEIIKNAVQNELGENK